MWDWHALLADALRLGVTVADFWAMTPAETLAVLDAGIWREELADRRIGWLAWHTAALQRAKRLPPLSRLVRKSKKRVSQAELARRRAEHAEMVKRNADVIERLRKRNG